MLGVFQLIPTYLYHMLWYNLNINIYLHHFPHTRRDSPSNYLKHLSFRNSRFKW